MKKQPRHLTEWAEDKSHLEILSAAESAGSADSAIKLFKSLRDGSIFKNVPRNCSQTEWLSLYKSHRKIQNVIADSNSKQYFEGTSNSEAYSEFQNHIRELKKLTPEEANKLVKDTLANTSQEERQETVDFWNEEIEDTLNSVANIPPINESFDTQIPKSPEFAFFIRVWMPCWIYNKEHHTTLFSKARRGNNAAIRKLAIIDKAVFFEPKISEHILQLYESGKIGAFNKIMTAFRSKPKKISPKNMKARLAALSQIQLQGLAKTTAPDFSKLYDSIARDRSGGKQLHDTDLPLTPESFSKAIQREKKELQ